MKTKAAVLVETGKPLVLTELEIPSLKPGQVLVEVLFSGVCHTQILEARGHRGRDAFLPHCLGHEGSGIVRETSAGVSKVKAGDAVVLTWMKGTGMDVPNALYDWNGRRVNAGAITTFQRFSVISENRLVVVPNDVPLKAAALVGCALSTGVGAVLNTARPATGQSLILFGAGGIGLFALSAAALSGCSPVVAVDINPKKLELALLMGATHVISSSKEDLRARLAEILPKGSDFAVEASGRAEVMSVALESVRQQGGTCVIIGNARFGEMLQIDPRQLNLGKRLFGTWGGDNLPDRDFPRYFDLLSANKLNLAPFLESVFRLNDVNKAMEAMEAGHVLRPLIDLSLEP